MTNPPQSAASPSAAAWHAALPLGHPTLRCADLAPEKHPAFSPNLYRWLRKEARFYREGGIAEAVFRVRPGTHAAQVFGAGTLVIGMAFDGDPDDKDFLGVPLISVLCEGAAAGRWCYAGMRPDIERIDNFWDRYLLVGRCACDPDHKEHFSSTAARYREEHDQRTCLWCGATFRRVETPRIVIDVSWAPSGADGAGQAVAEGSRAPIVDSLDAVGVAARPAV